MEKKDAARLLFLEGNVSQKQIAAILRTTENTISRWSKEEGWQDKKISVDLLQNNSTQHIMELIHYQTSMLKKLKDRWMEEPDNEKLISASNIDALQKLYTTVKKDARKFSDYVTIIKEFFEYLSNDNIELAKQLTNVGDMFLNDVAKKL